MFAVLRFVSRLGSIFAFLALIACGGGGGGGGGNTAFDLSTTAVTFSSRSDQTIAPLSQNVSARVTSGTVYFAARYSSEPTSPIAGVTVGTGLLSPTAMINITPKSGASLGVGTFTGTVTVFGCSDSACNSNVNGSPRTIVVTYTISQAPPGITLGATTLNFAATRGQSVPPSQDLAVTAESGANVSYTTSVSYIGTDATNWLTVPATATATNLLPISINSTSITGYLLARLTLTPTNTALPQSVMIYYSVQQPTLVFAPSPVSFTIAGNSLPSALQQNVSVSGSGGSTLNWTASSSTSWVSISPASGTTGDQLSVSLNPFQLLTLEPGQYTGYVQFNYSGAQTGSIQLPVQLNLQLPKVTMVTPYVTLTNSTEQVIVRGSGFNNITTERILFGTTPATAFTRIGDTELRVTPPALTPGRYAVAVENTPNISRTRAAQVVVDPATYAYAAQASAGEKSRIVYDAERQAVYVCNRTNSNVERYAFSTGAWNRTTSAVFGGLRALALAPDGTEITAVSSSVISLNPTTLSSTFRGGLYLPTGVVAEQIEYGNHGLATITTTGSPGVNTPSGGYYLLANSVWPAGGVGIHTSGRLASSRDGSRVFTASNGASTVQPVYYYENVAGNSFVATSVLRNVESMASDRTGERLVLVGLSATEVFDRNFALLGNLPNTTLAVTLTPNGQRAYTYDSGGTVRAFDLTASLALGTSVYPEIGSPTMPADSPGTGVVMTISPDSNTLLIAGNQRVLMMPAP